MRTSPTRAGAILVGLIALLLTAAVPAVAVGPLLTGGDDRVLVAQEPVESPLPGSDVPATPIPAPTPGPDLAAALGALLAQLPAALSDAILARPSETDASPSTLSPPISYGADGRFTLLLIGSDWRAHSGGERTDVLLVMSIDPITKRVAAASLPRDIVYFPRAPKNGGGTSGRSRINTMYYGYRRSGLKHVAVDRKALVALKRDVAFTLDTEIDGYVMIRFNGFVGLINRIKWLAVDIPAAINDPYYRKTHGVYFPVATKYRLKGNPPCADKPARCHSALAYARSRKGTVGTGSNGDFPRARRQQQLVMSAVSRVIDHIGSGPLLASMVRAVDGSVWTDLPITVPAALQLMDLLDGAQVSRYRSVVFGPRKWAYQDAQTPVYTYKLRVDLVRQWIDQRFRPVS